MKDRHELKLPEGEVELAMHKHSIQQAPNLRSSMQPVHLPNLREGNCLHSNVSTEAYHFSISVIHVSEPFNMRVTKLQTVNEAPAQPVGRS